MHAAVAAIIEHDGDAEQRLRALHRLGSDALVPLWTLVVESLDSDRGPSGAVDEVAWSALGTFGLAELRALLTGALEGTPTIGARVASLRLIQEFGMARDLTLGLRAATPMSGSVSPRLYRALGDAVTAMLLRDPATYRPLREEVLRAHPELRVALVRAVGAVRTSRSLDLLGFFLGFDGNLDVVLLGQIGVVAANLPKPVDAGIRGDVRGFLGHASPHIVQAAARACAELGDAEAMEALVELLERDDPAIASSAHWALRRLSGLGFPLDARRWRTWYRAETAWFKEHAARLCNQLSSTNRTLVVGAINQLSQHRMRRHRIAKEVAITLDSNAAEIRRLGCRALRQLDSSAALPALVRALEDEDEGVVQEAWNALRAITKQDLPPDPTLWAGVARGAS